MSHSDHFALLLAINHYPGLTDLDGPENDAKLFQEWLVSADGGDLPKSNVRLITSSDFQRANNPYDASPTRREFVRALDEWLREDGGWRDKVGTRLYLFFAGHGFTAGSSISDPALFTAAAQNSDPDHIAGYRYAAKIVNAGFFDEVILVMDCCQDVLKSSSVLEPTWSPPDRGLSASVKFLQAYGAPRGRKAFEDALDGDGTKRGLFSSVWIEALKSAMPDAEGWVTGQAIKNQALQIWASRFKLRTHYDPPIRLPDGEDIRFYQRTAAAPLPKVAVDVTVLVDQGAEALESIEPMPRRVPGRRGIDLESVAAPAGRREFRLRESGQRRLEMPPGLYSLKGDERDEVVEVLPRIGREPLPKTTPCKITIGKSAGPRPHNAPTGIQLETSDPGLPIIVTDKDFQKVGSGVGTLALELAPGLYKAVVTAPGAISESWLRVGHHSTVYTLPPVQFASAAPLEGTTTCHEYQHYPAIASVLFAAERFADGGEVFIFARISSETLAWNPAAPPWSSLRLIGLDLHWDLPLEMAGRTDRGARYATRKIEIPAGTYLLTLTETSGTATYEQGLVIPVVPGWRTEVYLDCIAAEAAGSAPETAVLDLASAALLLARNSAPSPLSVPIGRASELARLSLVSGDAAAVPAPDLVADAPLVGLLSACANALGRGDEAQRSPRVEECLAAFPAEFQAVPDVQILKAWAAGRTANWTTRPLPMLNLCWRLLYASNTDPQVAQAIEGLGQWRQGGSVWTQTRIPTSRTGMLRRKLQNHSSPLPTTPPVLRPAWTARNWEPLLGALRKPDPEASPFQQALRRRVLDGIDPDANKTEVYQLAAEFGLNPHQAAAAYREVFQSLK